MLDEFIDFTQSLFPSISPYVKERTKAAIKQFELNGNKLNLFNYKAYDYLTQGDIFDGIPFTRLEEDGSISAYRGKGMLISNTCSADHDDEIVIAPLLDMDSLGLNKADIVNNLHYRLLYLPDERYESYVVDFSLLNTFNKGVLNGMIEQGKVAKETSLNQFGFYLFLCKLTICFMRPEDEEVQADRRENYVQLHCAN